MAAITWLKYCRHSEKLYSINHIWIMNVHDTYLIVMYYVPNMISRFQSKKKWRAGHESAQRHTQTVRKIDSYLLMNFIHVGYKNPFNKFRLTVWSSYK